MDLRSTLNKVLQMRAGEKVTQIDELAVFWVFYVDDAPSILAAADLMAVDSNVLLRPNNRKRDETLQCGEL